MTASLPLENLLSEAKGAELSDAISHAGEGEQIVGLWDASTGFCVRVFLFNGSPLRWWFLGPMTEEQAAGHLRDLDAKGFGSLH